MKYVNESRVQSLLDYSKYENTDDFIDTWLEPYDCFDYLNNKLYILACESGKKFPLSFYGD